MSEVAERLPAQRQEQSRADWISDGLRLSHAAQSVMFEVGDWWNNPPDGVDRLASVRSEEWQRSGGLTHGSCRNAGYVAARWPVSTRVDGLTWDHHRAVTKLADAEAVPLLQAAVNQGLSAAELRAMVKRDRRTAREAALGEKQQSAPAEHGKRYGVIYADPPWRFEPYSRETGMDRAADNHYPTMTLGDICALEVPAADDCVLFLWATVPMLPEALLVMQAWGFRYRSHFVWLKDRAGTGYWNRNRHELLLVGTRGDIPAPAPGEQYSSVIDAEVGAHSAKPPHFAEMIEDMFPNLPAIELFAREPRQGWDVWGNEAAA